MSAAERASGASSAEQANKRADERMAQYLCPDYRLVKTIVLRLPFIIEFKYVTNFSHQISYKVSSQNRSVVAVI